LFDDLGIEPTKFTANGNPSTDEDALEKIKHPLVKKIVALRKLKKNHGTYFSGLIRETVEGTLHPFFHLNTVKTFRSSSSNPNFQNIPVRNTEARNLIRAAIIPSKGNRILEIDYSGAEVRVAACVTGDKQLIKYVTDPTTDMHRDMAQEIYFLEQDEVNKDIRYTAKNSFVFPQFYGAIYKTCAQSLWEAIPATKLKVGDMSLKKHLKNCAIKDYFSFQDHIEKVEDYFWNEKFKEYTKWKKEILKSYNENGYIDLITGFRCSGAMETNQALNVPIQGPAFHCLLWSLIELDKIRIKNKWKAKIIGQIHDSIVWDVPADEFDEVLETTRRVSCDDIRKAWDWLTVPLEIEAEATDIDGSWNTKKEIKIK